MTTTPQKACWDLFLETIQERCSKAEYQNWFAPIKVLESSDSGITLEVPNIFVQEYIADNYQDDIASFLPPVTFVIAKAALSPQVARAPEPVTPHANDTFLLNDNYTFETFIEGPSNQFIKSAALGVATRPGKSYNPLFIHGGVGLGKTHLLHAIGHYAKKHHKKLRIHCITTESFINDLVLHLRNKKVDTMKKFYRSLDVLLVDDIQFLQNRLGFEEEFCNMFETLINQNKQIVITSDKPPGELKLSERMIARMEWGLVAHVGAPDVETRVAILQSKAEQRGLTINQQIAFYIAEHIYNNVRQLEGAINRLCAYCKLMSLDVTVEVVEKSLHELFEKAPDKNISIDTILESVASMYNVRVSDLKGSVRKREIAFPRQIAMYLAKELLSDSLAKLAGSFGGKTHSTLLHAWKKVSEQINTDDTLRRQIDMAKSNIKKQ